MSDKYADAKQMREQAQCLNQQAAQLQLEAGQKFFDSVEGRKTLDDFWERYRLMSQAEILPLIVLSHPDYNDKFRQCLEFCFRYRLYGFGTQVQRRQPPVPVDEAFGPTPKVDYEARHREALQIVAGIDCVRI